MPPKKAISLEQRKALRAYHRGYIRQHHHKPTHKASITWFLNTYGRRISQSTISESLSCHYIHLDNSTSDLQTFRTRDGQWPELEQFLFQWQRQIESRGGLTTGDLIRVKAKEIWEQLPKYANQPTPAFSDGWLARFKKRHSIRNYTKHGEAGSVAIDAAEEMKAIRTIAGEYDEKDIYNMDETGLFWRLSRSNGLSSAPGPGVKKNKARITVVLCANAAGTDRFKPWFIGHAKTPRALQKHPSFMPDSASNSFNSF